MVSAHTLSARIVGAYDGVPVARRIRSTIPEDACTISS